MPKIWAALPLRGADPHREKFLLLVEVVATMNGAIGDLIAQALGFLYSPRFAWGGRPHRRFISVRERG